MNVGPYQQQQQNYPQLHPAPPSDNSFGNVPRAVNNDMVARGTTNVCKMNYLCEET